jgi:hypothetical protein
VEIGPNEEIVFRRNKDRYRRQQTGQLTAPFRAREVQRKSGTRPGRLPRRRRLSSPDDTHHHEDIFLAYVGHHPLGDALERSLRQKLGRSLVWLGGGITHANGLLKEMYDKPGTVL